MKQFYRVLTPKCADEPGTILRWQKKQFTSTHGKPPGHWIERWTKDRSSNPADYPLDWNRCRYTLAARQAFLELAPKHETDDIWPPHERNRTGEYEGVSAFDNVREALKYGEGAPGKLYVVFEGEPLLPLPEDNGYAVRPTTELLPPMNRDEFENWISEGCHVNGKLGTYGCACRCLLKLLADAGKPIPDGDFVSKFTPDYPHWATRCGLTDTAMICELAKNLQLARGVQVFRDFAKVVTETRASGCVGILVCVERFPKNIFDHSAGLDCIYHCMLLTNADQTTFTLWSPMQDGSECVLPPFSVDWWDKLLAHVVVLHR